MPEPEVSQVGAKAPRRRRRSRAEGLALGREFRASGQSLLEFSRARGVPEPRVRYWRQQAEQEQAAASATGDAPAFFTLAVEGSEDSQAQIARRGPCAGIEIRLGDSLCIVLPARIAQPEFVQTLRGVLEALER